MIQTKAASASVLSVHCFDVANTAIDTLKRALFTISTLVLIHRLLVPALSDT